jgi:UDPglucose 6-dehydrogenase
MNNFGIVGYGIVGKATHHGLLKEQFVTIYDTSRPGQLSDLVDCNQIFFCIPTNNNEDIKTLIELIKEIKLSNPSYCAIIRSTVPIGTCKYIEEQIQDAILYIPEFLRDRMWEVDCFNRPVIVGGHRVLPEWLKEEEIIRCSLEEAEVTKMFSNNIAAARIILANHFYEISRAVGADYNNVLAGYLKVNHDQNYLEVSDTLRAFGGKCLPKDLEFLINTMSKLDIPQTYFTAIKEDNQLWPVTVRES